MSNGAHDYDPLVGDTFLSLRDIVAEVSRRCKPRRIGR